MTSQHRERSKKVPSASGSRDRATQAAAASALVARGVRQPCRPAAGGGGASTLDDQVVGHLEPIMVDQPADAVQHRGFRFEGRVVAEQGAGLFNRGVLAAR